MCVLAVRAHEGHNGMRQPIRAAQAAALMFGDRFQLPGELNLRLAGWMTAAD
jgi:hypothetical protein